MLTHIFGAVTGGRLNLRAAANSSTTILASIPDETLLVVTAHDDTWYANRLKLCLNLSFACSLRLGELLALTWDCVDISEESIREGKASIFVNKELQRVNKKIMKTLDSKDVIRVFPEAGA